MTGRRPLFTFIFAALLNASPCTLLWGGNEGAIEVKLTSAVGQPIAEGTVWLKGPLNRAPGSMEQSKQTNKAGIAIFRNLAQGTYSITAQKQGFVGGLPISRPSSSLVLIGPGQTRQPVLLVLKRGISISGKVTSNNGVPVPGLRIAIGELGYQNGRKMLLTRQSTVSDFQGIYRLSWSGSNDCYIFGESQPSLYAEAPLQSSAQQRIWRTYYPGTVDFAKAKPLTANSTDDFTAIDFALQQVNTHRVRGRILNVPPLNHESRKMPPTFALVARNDNAVDSLPYSALLDKLDPKTGEFELSGIPAGAWTLFAAARIPNMASIMNPPVPLISSGRIPINIAGSDLDSVTIQLSSVDVKGKVIITKPQAGGLPGVPAQKLRINLQPRESVPMEISIALQAFQEVASDGSFEFRGVPPGKYCVVLSGAFPVTDIRVGAKSIFNDGILHIDSKSPDPIQVIVESTNSGIGGTVLGITPRTTVERLASTRIILIPDPPRRQNTTLYKSMELNSIKGDFFFGTVPPGKYKVFAIKDLPQGAEMDPDVLARYENRGKSVTVGEGVSRALVDWIQK
jgi:hypothetical protein